MSGRRPSVLCPAALVILLAAPAFAAAEASDDTEALRRQWYRCVRQAFSGQPARIETHAAQRAALSACKPAEDAYVAAVMAGDEAERQAGRGSGSLTSRARAWMASVAATMVDPLTSWIGGWAK